jgi:hypothetical protein
MKKFVFPLPKVETKILKTLEALNYHILSFNLNAGLPSTRIELAGNFIYVKEGTDYLTNINVKLNSSVNDAINLKRRYGIISDFKEFYLDAEIQENKSITLFVSDSYEKLRIFEQIGETSIFIAQTQEGILNEPILFDSFTFITSGDSPLYTIPSNYYGLVDGYQLVVKNADASGQRMKLFNVPPTYPAEGKHYFYATQISGNDERVSSINGLNQRYKPSSVIYGNVTIANKITVNGLIFIRLLPV